MKCKNKIEMLDNMKNSISVFFPEGVIKSNNINNWKFKTPKFHVSTYTGIPIFEFSFSITLQNISGRKYSSHSQPLFAKRNFAHGKSFCFTFKKYKSKLSFCTKKGPNYGHVGKFKRKTLIKRSIQGFDFIWFGYWIYSILCICVCLRLQTTNTNFWIYNFSKKSREIGKKIR